MGHPKETLQKISFKKYAYNIIPAIIEMFIPLNGGLFMAC